MKHTLLELEFRLIYWTPRVLGMLFIGFISVFALDAFDGSPVPEMLTHFASHLVPSAALAGLLALAWKKPDIGGGVFLVIAFGLALVARNHPTLAALLALPFVVIGAAFLYSWKVLGRSKPPAQAER